MKKSLALASVVGALALAPLSAFSQVTEISGNSGSVIVQRGSSTFTLEQGSEIQEGDRIVTRGGGNVTVEFGGCSKTIGSSSMMVVDSQFCTKAPTRVRFSGSTTSAAGTGTGLGGFTTLSTPLIIGAGVAAITIIAVASDDDSESP